MDLEFNSRDFPDSPVVKTLPSSEGGVGLIPGRGVKISQVLKAKNQNIKYRSNIVTNLKKELYKWSTSKKLKKNCHDGEMTAMLVMSRGSKSSYAQSPW